MFLKIYKLENSKFHLFINIRNGWDKFFMDIINSDYFTEDVKVVLPGDDFWYLKN